MYISPAIKGAFAAIHRIDTWFGARLLRALTMHLIVSGAEDATSLGHAASRNLIHSPHTPRLWRSHWLEAFPSEEAPPDDFHPATDDADPQCVKRTAGTEHNECALAPGKKAFDAGEALAWFKSRTADVAPLHHRSSHLTRQNPSDTTRRAVLFA
ncbi:hypothetical protein ADL21_02855 [Streptomyces albus subsp. albus]|nr:hypothetical protein ADL21_02855 [Streptomyces albus subsp. albus]